MSREPGVFEQLPSARLRAQVASIQIIVSDGTPVSVLPSTSMVLGFQFEGRIRAEEGLLAPAGVTGLQESPRRYQYLGATSSVMVRFTPLGASCLGAPADELATKSVPLDGILSPAAVRQTLERVGEAKDNRARVLAVEDLLTQLPWEPDALMAEALSQLEGGAPVSLVARGLGISERQLEPARELLKTTLHFVAHHGENEDVLLIPIVRAHHPALADRMEAAHAQLNPALERLRRVVDSESIDALYALTNRFLSAYLEHMHEEETVFDAEIRAACSPEELMGFGKQSVVRTAPADQLMMLGWMLPALPPDQTELFSSRLPPEVRSQSERK